MSQPPLFVEDIYEALGAIVTHLGGAKSVGSMFWPAKSAHDAGKLLKDCLNPERNEKLDPEQVLLLFRLARETNFHVSKHWFDTETGYEPSAPTNPKDEQARLLDVIETAGQTLQKALSALDKLRERKSPTLSKVA